MSCKPFSRRSRTSGMPAIGCGSSTPLRTTRRRPARSVTRMVPSGAKAMANGRLRPLMGVHAIRVRDAGDVVDGARQGVGVRRLRRCAGLPSRSRLRVARASEADEHEDADQRRLHAQVIVSSRLHLHPRLHPDSCPFSTRVAELGRFYRSEVSSCQAYWLAPVGLAHGPSLGASPETHPRRRMSKPVSRVPPRHGRA